MKNSEHRELSCRSLKQWRRFLSCRTWKGISQNPHTSERRLGKGDSHYHRASSSLRCLYIAIDYIHLYPIKRSGEDQLVLCNLSASRLQFVGSSVSRATRNALGVSHQAVLMPFLCLTRFSRCRGEDKNATPQQTCSYTVVAFDRGETEDRCSQALALPALPLETSRLVECHNVGFFFKMFFTSTFDFIYLYDYSMYIINLY